MRVSIFGREMDTEQWDLMYIDASLTEELALVRS